MSPSRLPAQVRRVLAQQANDLQTLMGETVCGRATIETLCLNRSNVMNLRRVLVLVGEQPAQV